MKMATKKRESSDATGAQLLFEKTASACDTWMAEGCLNKGMGFSIHTPNAKIEHLGFSPQNKTGDSNSTWQVYSRHRRYHKKSQMGYSHIATVTETEMSSLHNQHLPDMAQVGNVLNDIIVPGRESVPQKEGDDVTSENHQI